MPLTLTSLGCASALPTRDTYFTAHVLNIRGRLFLLDCGEGTQLRLRQLGISTGSIDHVFITHLHGDHVFGLLGMLSTMHLLNRKRPLYIHAPVGLEKMIAFYFDFLGEREPSFDIVHEKVETEGLSPVLETDTADVYAFPLNHSIPAYGYLFREKPVRRSYPRSVAYCTDTAPRPEIPSWIKGVDLLFHEATFLEQDSVAAEKYLHSTARQAARTALDAGAGQLLLGHFSSRYKKTPAFLAEAREIFPNTELSTEGRTFSVPRRFIQAAAE
jgi:ribonuclease Z